MMRMAYAFATRSVTVMTAVITGCAAVPTPMPMSQSLWSGAATTAAPTVQFERLVVALPPGTRIGDLRGGVFCRVRDDLVWDGEPARFGARSFVDVLEDKLARAGANVTPRRETLFAAVAAPSVDLQIGGRVEALEAHLCLPLAGYGTSLHSQGTASIQIHWQLYAPAQQRIVYEATMQGTATGANARSEWELIAAAYAQAVDRLLLDPMFQRALRPAEGAPTAPTLNEPG